MPRPIHPAVTNHDRSPSAATRGHETILAMPRSAALVALFLLAGCVTPPLPDVDGGILEQRDAATDAAETLGSGSVGAFVAPILYVR
jgi:hypothetical protein